MKKKILILQAGVSQTRIIHLAKRMGVSVIVLDRNEHAPGLKAADFPEVVDPNDLEGSLKIAKKYDIDGVLPGGDVSLKTAAYIAEDMDLIGLSLEQANTATDKEKYITEFKKCGIPYSESFVTDNVSDCEIFIKDFGLPVILKPTLSFGGSRGVIRINSIKELADGFLFSKQFSQNGRIIIEKFYDGQEHTVESIIYNGKNHVLAISDKERINEKYCLATSLNYPTQLPHDIIAQIKTISQNISSSLGLSNWITHTEIITINGEAKVIDFGARGGAAGYIPSVIVPNVCGVNMMEEYIRMLLREKPQNLQIKTNQNLIYRFFTHPPGKILDILGIIEVKSNCDVLDLDFFLQPGDVIKPLKSQLDRVGFFVVKGETANDVQMKAKKIENSIEFVCSPNEVN